MKLRSIYPKYPKYLPMLPSTPVSVLTVMTSSAVLTISLFTLIVQGTLAIRCFFARSLTGSNDPRLTMNVTCVGILFWRDTRLLLDFLELWLILRLIHPVTFMNYDSLTSNGIM
jgi:hypothetical protein